MQLKVYGTETKKMLNILILEILRNYFDMEHHLTQQEIMRKLKADYGIEKIDRRSVKARWRNCMGYSRAIKLDINNINSLYYALSKGKLKQFVDCVKESQSADKKLMLCFRTNKGKETVTIYYNNHQVWKLYISNQNPVVEISGNHARDSKNWFDLLKGIGVDEETLNNSPRKDIELS